MKMEDKEETQSKIYKSFKSVSKKDCQRFIQNFFQYLKMAFEKKNFL